MKGRSSDTSWRKNKRLAAVLALVAFCSLACSGSQGQLSGEQFVHNLYLFGSAFLVAHYIFKNLKIRALAALAFSVVCFTPPLRQAVCSCEGDAFRAMLLTSLCFTLMRAVEKPCLLRMSAAGVFCGSFLWAAGHFLLLPLQLVWLYWLRRRGRLALQESLHHGFALSSSSLLTLFSLWSLSSSGDSGALGQQIIGVQVLSFLLLTSLLGLFFLSMKCDRFLTSTLLLPAVLVVFLEPKSGSGFIPIASIPVAWLALLVGFYSLVRSAMFVADGILVTKGSRRRIRLLPGYLTLVKVVRRLLHHLDQGVSSNWAAELEYRYKIEVENACIARWLTQNPGKIYADYYAHKQRVLLEKGGPHPTLGTQLKGPKTFEEMGTSAFQLFRRQGLESHHKLVDYGCGSLRLGQHTIPYLNEGHYFGLDLVDYFFEIGRKELLDQNMLAEKQPILRVINDESLLNARLFYPDFVISFAVLVHVPPPELDRYFANLFYLAHEKTTLLIHGDLAEQRLRYSLESWAHSQSHVERTVKRLGGQITYIKSKPAIFRSRPKNLPDLAKERAVRTVWMKITFQL